MSPQYSFVAAIFFAVVAYVPSHHFLTPKNCSPAALPLIQPVEQTKVNLGSAAPAVPSQSASVEPSPCHARRQAR
jgi:hypothetical protein